MLDMRKWPKFNYYACCNKHPPTEEEQQFFTKRLSSKNQQRFGLENVINPKNDGDVLV
jgi:hypothetical protein